ncbi:MAG: hypothetical protein ACXU9U_01210 [Parachlamydiaceae bacterium]
MDPSIINLIISLISGAVGGNVAGTAVKDKSLGTPSKYCAWFARRWSW